ncbi:hypothetical protein SLEP1_g48944 [Rubroshorea leprosula]|uniref:Ribulose-phosphate 3-epimerase n=1 Tax=Rubroshorea leprosula TaxID=152421 RepID=A0AAV5LW44_9ROSI|nr:hypothetical protein SLEP1_g48944 [Rubroshorea leprosula]
MAASAGANCIVAGTSVFGAPQPAEAVSLLRRSVVETQKNADLVTGKGHYCWMYRRAS